MLDKKFGGPTVTNDGVTIAREIELDDPFENLGAQLAKTVATKTNDVAGDGTTTATVLAQALVTAGLRNVAAGANPTALRPGIAAAADKVIEVLQANGPPRSTARTHIAQVGTIASREQEIGDLIGEAIEKVGEDGVITVEEGSTLTIELEITEGLQFDKGYISPYFVTDAEAMEAVLENAYVLLLRDKISALADLLPLLEKVLADGKPLLIVAEDVEGEALSTLVVNSIRKTLQGRRGQVAVLRRPPQGVHGRPGDRHRRQRGQRRGRPQADRGRAGGARHGPPRGGHQGQHHARRGRQAPKDAVAGRIAQIKREIDETDSDWDREKLQERLAKLSGGVAVIKVGAATETDAQGAQAPHRGRGVGDQGRGRGGHHPRRRVRARARGGGARRRPRAGR